MLGDEQMSEQEYQRILKIAEKWDRRQNIIQKLKRQKFDELLKLAGEVLDYKAIKYLQRIKRDSIYPVTSYVEKFKATHSLASL